MLQDGYMKLCCDPDTAILDPFITVSYHRVYSCNAVIPDSPRYLALLCVLASSSAASATAVAVVSKIGGSGYLLDYLFK